MLPRVARFGIGFEFFEPRFKFGLEFGRDLDGLRNGRDTFPNQLYEPNALLHREFKDLGKGDMFHG